MWQPPRSRSDHASPPRMDRVIMRSLRPLLALVRSNARGWTSSTFAERLPAPAVPTVHALSLLALGDRDDLLSGTAEQGTCHARRRASRVMCTSQQPRAKSDEKAS